MPFVVLYSNKFPMIIYDNPGKTYASLQELNKGTCNFAITNLDLAESMLELGFGNSKCYF